MNPDDVDLEDEPDYQPPDIHVDLGVPYYRKLYIMARDKHNDNLSATLRLAIDRLFEHEYEDDEDNERTLDRIKKGVSDLLQQGKSILQELKEIRNAIEDLKNLVRQAEPPSQSVEYEAKEAANEIHSILVEAEKPLTIDGISSRSSLPVTAISNGVALLIDEGMITDVSDDKLPKFDLSGMGSSK